MQIDVLRNHEHYEIYLNGKFYCSCENMYEVTEELELLEDLEQAA